MEYNLQRFIDAQNTCYDSARDELARGVKTGHWMWFMFPQLKGLGKSSNSNYYGLSGLDEAKAYFDNPILKQRLIELCEILLFRGCDDPRFIFGGIDVKKLKSSMTIFYLATNEQIFMDVLKQYYGGELDQKTIDLLNNK